MKVMLRLAADVVDHNAALVVDDELQTLQLSPVFRFGAKYARLGTLVVVSDDGTTRIENELLVHRATGKLAVRPPSADTAEFDKPQSPPATGS